MMIDRRHLLAGGVGLGAGALALVGGASPAGAAPSPNYHNVKTDNAAHGHPNAVGDGTTDDTVAVQRALDLAAFGVGDFNVWFPAGTYKVTAPLTVQTNVSLVGVGSGFDPLSGISGGPQRSVINGSSIRTGPVLASGTGIHGVSVINMQLRGAPAGSCSYPTLLQRGHRNLVLGSRILEGGNGAVEWRGVSVSDFVRSWVGGEGKCARGLWLVNSPDNTIEANQMTTGSGPTALGGSGDVLVIQDSDHNIVRGNFIFYGDRGVVLGGQRHVLDANRIDTNWREGVVVQGDGHAIVGNLLHTNGRGGKGTPPQPRVAGIRIDPGKQVNHVVGNATRQDNPLEAFAPCQRPGVQDASGNTTNEIVASGPVWP